MALLFLPTIFLITSIILKLDAGPSWLWSNLDPDYWYLFDSLNMVNLNWPQHINHPGTTVQFIGAAMIKLLFPLTSAEQINQIVLANPEYYLVLISRVLLSLNVVALVFIGVAGYLTFKDVIGAMLLQTGPFLSQLTFKHSLHVAPEPLLITVMIILGGVMILALRPGQMKNHRNAYVIAFAIIAGFGMATKITSVGLYLLPVLLIGRVRPIILYGFASMLFMVIFTLPAAGSYPKILDFISVIFLSSAHFGTGNQTIIDLSSYPGNLWNVSSRPVFWVTLLISLILIGWVRLKRWNEGLVSANITLALGGLCLAFVVQALVVAKHPAGHYMIPALTTSALGFALIYFLAKALCKPTGKAFQAVRIGFFIFLIVLVGTQGRAIYKLDQEFIVRDAGAKNINETIYSECAKIYFWPTSNPLYALFLASWNTNNSFADVLQHLYPGRSSLFITPNRVVKDMSKSRDIRSIASNYPCIFVRGSFTIVNKQHLAFPFPYREFSKIHKMKMCDFKAERIYTWGIDCRIDCLSTWGSECEVESNR
ncbi:MAG: hypothetical protein HON14_15095 [Rhodospirillaceae bacterium]|nr:hypothetical protein [Rhodospirillaceae bacterium]MBT7267432.1 hypothetical protein [Rhodospirillaceae bacterium]